jgi:hypothetical protein
MRLAFGETDTNGVLANRLAQTGKCAISDGRSADVEEILGKRAEACE